MRILIVYQNGKRGWGTRIKTFISENNPDSWEFKYQRIKANLPQIIDNPDHLLPDELPVVDMLIVLAENTGLAQLIPDLANKTGSAAVIAPVDNRQWFPRGLQNQIKIKLDEIGVDYAFPEPFCSLVASEKSSDLLKEFNIYFGKPLVKFDCADHKLVDFKIIRESPCGVIRNVMQNIKGLELNDIARQGGLYHQYYPCLASVDLIHSSAHITETAIKKACKKQLNKI